MLTKTENQRLTWRKSANRMNYQIWKTAIFGSENRKTEPKIGQIRKTENPNAPLFKVPSKAQFILKFDGFLIMIVIANKFNKNSVFSTFPADLKKQQKACLPSGKTLIERPGCKALPMNNICTLVIFF